MTMTFIKAKQLFDEGKYQQALHAYEELGKVYGLAVVEYNLQLCREKQKSTNVNPQPENNFLIVNDNTPNKTETQISKLPSNNNALDYEVATIQKELMKMMESNSILEAENKFLLQHISVLQVFIENHYKQNISS